MTPAEPAATTVLRLRPDRTQRLEALLLGAGPHLEAVLDVGTATNGDLVVVLPAPAARLPSLLEPAGGLTAGEAVTVLAPLAQSLRRLHDAGVAHGGIRPAAIVLDADGSPAWAAPVAPTLLRRVGPGEFAARVAEDVAGYRASAAALLDPLGARLPEGADLDALALALFDLAHPEAVRLVRPAVPPASGPPARLLPAVPPEPVVAGRRVDLGGAVRGQLRLVRRRVWIALGGVAALLVAAAVVLPSGGSAPAAVPVASPTRAAARPTTAATPVAGRSTDAASALAALVRAREACLASGSEACIRRVDGVGSPVLDADLRALASGVEWVRVDPSALRVGAVAGGTVLATAGGTTVLAIRGRDEWRLRDVVAEPPAGG